MDLSVQDENILTSNRILNGERCLFNSFLFGKYGLARLEGVKLRKARNEYMLSAHSETPLNFWLSGTGAERKCPHGSLPGSYSRYSGKHVLAATISDRSA